MKTKEIPITSLRLPIELKKKIIAKGKKEHRNFTQQVIYEFSKIFA